MLSTGMISALNSFSNNIFLGLERIRLHYETCTKVRKIKTVLKNCFRYSYPQIISKVVCQDISSNAISTYVNLTLSFQPLTISTYCIFNRLQFRPKTKFLAKYSSFRPNYYFITKVSDEPNRLK